MANAAAKKAAAAKQEAAKTYLPLLLVTNVIYIVLLLGSAWQTKLGIVGALVSWAEQAYAYFGILENSASHASKPKSKQKDLAGGSSLDLLAVTVVVQYLSVLHSSQWLWVTIVGVPVVGAYGLYRSFYGSGGDTKSKSVAPPADTSGDPGDDPKAARRQRRAEKRQQKWK